jgi:hypothetical protein
VEDFILSVGRLEKHVLSFMKSSVIRLKIRRRTRNSGPHCFPAKSTNGLYENIYISINIIMCDSNS